VLLPLGIALLATATALGVRWAFRRVDELGRRRSFPAISVGLCAVTAVACVVPVGRTMLLERRLSTAASVIVGAPVVVHCERFGESWLHASSHLGWVQWGPGGVPERRTVLAGTACSDLRSWLSGLERVPEEGEVIAVHVLTHESMHMAGIREEDRAECQALQRDAGMAILLGAQPRVAEDLARRYWRDVYPRMPDGYFSSACVKGGAMDAGVTDAPWE
jgi:hypothetical protein